MANWTPKQFERALRGAAKRAPKRVDRAMAKAIGTQERRLRVLAPKVTGALRHGWTVAPMRGGVAVSNVAPYAPYVESQIRNGFGAAHDIARKAVIEIIDSILKLK